MTTQLARQAVLLGVCGELECFELLQSGGCSAAPRFLGHAERIQGEHERLPDGYIRYLVREEVPGEPMTAGFFSAWMTPDVMTIVPSSVLHISSYLVAAQN
ncbi:hypothetical protein V6Z90_009106 [Aspergillus fumigatus]